MQLSIQKLEESGYRVQVSKTEININPTNCDSEAHNRLHDMSDYLGFNSAEHDQLFNAVYLIQVMSAIRKCSNW